jgi:hypothetical protein
MAGPHARQGAPDLGVHPARVQIVSSEATVERGRIVDRFILVEFDGAPLRVGRHGAPQVEVLAAIDAMRERR